MVTSPRLIGVSFSVGVVGTPVVTTRVVAEVGAVGEEEGIALSHCLPVNWGGHAHVQNVPALVWRVPPFWHVNVQGTA